MIRKQLDLKIISNMPKIYVACDGDWEEPEVQFSGSVKALSDFGKLLNKAEGHSKWTVPVKKNEYYPVNIESLSVGCLDSENDRITVAVNEDILSLEGTPVALNKLGDSLVNFFDTETLVGEYFQLDYYDGNQVLNETKCHLIFIRDA